MLKRSPLVARLVGAAMAIAMLVVSGCGGDDTDPSAATTTTKAFDLADVTRRMARKLTVTTDGATAFSFDDEAELTIMEIDATAGTDFRLLSVGLEDPLAIGEGNFRIAFDLTGIYTGAGEYEMPKSGAITTPSLDPENAGAGANAAAVGMSRVYFTYSPLGDLTKPAAQKAYRSYDTLVEPCSIDVERDALAGSVSCPALADSAGRTIKLEMSWGEA